MARYLISFPSDAMNHIPAEDLPAVGDAAGAVVQEAMDAGVGVVDHVHVDRHPLTLGQQVGDEQRRDWGRRCHHVGSISCQRPGRA